MARRKVICALQLENWQQADDALRQIGETDAIWQPSKT